MVNICEVWIEAQLMNTTTQMAQMAKTFSGQTAGFAEFTNLHVVYDFQ